MSINCKSSRYYFGIGYALVMIFVYPIGIPVRFSYGFVSLCYIGDVLPDVEAT